MTADPELQAQVEACKTASLACVTLGRELAALVQELRDITKDLLALRDEKRVEAQALFGEVEKDTDLLLDF